MPEIEKIQPFRITKLTDVIDEEVLQMIQTGVSERLKVPVTIVEKRGREWNRIDPVIPFQHFCDFCRYFRGESNSETDKECLGWDFKKAEEILQNDNHDPVHFPCCMVLRGVAFPMVIDGKIIAVLFSGQKRFEGMDYDVKEQARQMAKEYKRLNFRKMKRLLGKMDVVTESEIRAFMGELTPMVKHITALGEQNYVIKKRLQEEQFLDELSSYFRYNYEEDISPLWSRLEKTLQRVNEFADTQVIMFFTKDRESKTWLCKAGAGIPEDLVLHFRLDCTQIEDFESGMPVNIDEHSLFLDGKKADMEGYLGNYYPFHVPLRRNLAGLLILKKISEKVVSVDVEGDSLSVDVEVALLKEIADVINVQIRAVYFEVDQHQRSRDQEKHIQELEEVDKEREEFMIEMAHALRAPMQSILSESEYIARRRTKMSRPDWQITKSSNKIIEEVGILKNKLDNSLLFGDVDRRLIEYNFRENSLVSLIEECADLFRDAAERERDINIILEVDGLPDFKFDRDKMDIVFTNVLDNAIKFSHGGKDIFIRGTIVKNKIEIEIEDFGLGIKEEEKGKIFQKYYRAQLKDRRRFIQGTGIGLTVTRKIVEDHGGSIYVDSRPAAGIDHDPEKVEAGEGFITTFTVTLPYQMNEEEK